MSELVVDLDAGGIRITALAVDLAGAVQQPADDAVPARPHAS